jgi:WD40 repeat protein
MVQLSKKTNAHSDTVRLVAFSPDGTKIVSGSRDKTIKVWDTDSFDLLETRPGEAMAFSKEVEGVVRDGATIRMKEGGGAFYAPSPISCMAVNWPRIAAGASSGELYHLEVMM